MKNLAKKNKSGNTLTSNKEINKGKRERENNISLQPEEKFYLLEEDKQREIRIATMKFKQNLKSKLLLRSFKLKYKDSISKLRYLQLFNKYMKKNIVSILSSCSRNKI